MFKTPQSFWSRGPLDPTFRYLGPGEQQAIQLAAQLRADAILIEDKQGRAEPAKRNLGVIGTLGVLTAAAEKAFLDLPDAILRLRQTHFRIAPQILEVLLNRFSPLKPLGLQGRPHTQDLSFLSFSRRPGKLFSGMSFARKPSFIRQVGFGDQQLVPER